MLHLRIEGMLDRPGDTTNVEDALNKSCFSWSNDVLQLRPDHSSRDKNNQSQLGKKEACFS